MEIVQDQINKEIDYEDALQAIKKAEETNSNSSSYHYDSHFNGMKRFIKDKARRINFVKEEEQFIFIDVSFEGLPLKVALYINKDADVAVIQVFLPFRCPEKFYLLLKNKITRLNRKLIIPGFDFDEDNGAIYYMYTYSIKGQNFSTEHFANMFYKSLVICHMEFIDIERYTQGRLSAEEKAELFKEMKMLFEVLKN